MVYQHQLNEMLYKYFNETNQTMREFAEERPCHMVSSIVSFFDLFEFGFDCTDNYNGITDDIVFAPNPNNGNFSIFNNSDQQIESGIAIVTNSLGQKVYENTLFSLSPGDKHYFSLGDLIRLH